MVQLNVKLLKLAKAHDDGEHEQKAHPECYYCQSDVCGRMPGEPGYSGPDPIATG